MRCCEHLGARLRGPCGATNLPRGARDWHTPQPFAEPFDIEAPVEAILAETEAICRNRPGFVSRADWRQIQVERMGV